MLFKGWVFVYWLLYCAKFVRYGLLVVTCDLVALCVLNVVLCLCCWLIACDYFGLWVWCYLLLFVFVALGLLIVFGWWLVAYWCLLLAANGCVGLVTLGC